jgi:hypothetical protein
MKVDPTEGTPQPPEANLKLANYWQSYLRGAGIEYKHVFFTLKDGSALKGFELPEFYAFAVVKEAFDARDVQEFREALLYYKQSCLLLEGEPSARTYTRIDQSGSIAQVILARCRSEFGRLWYYYEGEFNQDDLEDYPKDTGEVVARGLKAVQKWRVAAEDSLLDDWSSRWRRGLRE